MQIKSMKCIILQIIYIKILQIQHRILSFFEIIDEMHPDNFPQTFSF